VYRQNERLLALLAPIIEAMGYECWGIEQSRQGRDSVLRVYIDRTGGVRIADCERVSNQIAGVLDVEDPIAGRYLLEVSSPGLDRPLFNLDQCRRFVGHEARLKLRSPVGGRRRLRGRIAQASATELLLLTDEGEFRIDAALIERARLVPVPGKF
jgi:ribosome maturation factor RimP